jgi:hypothetical protein
VVMNCLIASIYITRQTIKFLLIRLSSFALSRLLAKPQPFMLKTVNVDNFKKAQIKRFFIIIFSTSLKNNIPIEVSKSLFGN